MFQETWGSKKWRKSDGNYIQTASLTSCTKRANGYVKQKSNRLSTFLINVREVVEKRIKDPVGRLIIPIKLADSKIKDMIKPCIHMSLEGGYQRAMMMLNRRYGNPHSLLASFRKVTKGNLGMPQVSEGFLIFAEMWKVF